MKKILTFTSILLLMSIALGSQAQFSFSSNPVWQVSKSYPTGLGWADFDHNGFPDVVVSVGLDIVNGPTLIYNNENGTLPADPGWSSTYLAPGCGLYLNDFDKNGDVDIAVASLGLISNGMLPVPNYLFYNQNGLSPNPGWLSLPGNSFSCTGGDINGDGLIDLVFSRGDFATSKAEKTILFINSNGLFDSIPDWESDSTYFGTDVALADIDLDGDLDLALGARTKGVLVFFSDNGVLETSPSWHSSQVAGARQMAFGDVDNDGYPDLAVASPGQKFFLFKNVNGVLDTIPQWVSMVGTEPSAVAWADVDGDGDLDLGAGSWNSAFGIFENVNGMLADTFAWSKAVGGGTQQISWMDYDKDNLTDTVKTHIGDGHKKLFYIGKQPLHQLSSVKKNGIVIPENQYCFDLIDGWISFSIAPGSGDTMTIQYLYSKDLDLSLTTWSNVMLFENLNTSTGIRPQRNLENSPSLRQNQPNPCHGSTTVTFFLPRQDYNSLKIYNSQGIEMATLLKKRMTDGVHTFDFSVDQLPAGLYNCSLQGSGYCVTKKMIVQ